MVGSGDWFSGVVAGNDQMFDQEDGGEFGAKAQKKQHAAMQKNLQKIRERVKLERQQRHEQELALKKGSKGFKDLGTDAVKSSTRINKAFGDVSKTLRKQMGGALRGIGEDAKGVTRNIK